MLRFSIRHMLRHWRMNLILLFGLTLASALLAGLPAYAEAIAARTLASELAVEPPASRNIEIHSLSDTLVGAQYAQAVDALGNLIVMRIETRSSTIPADPIPIEPIDENARLAPQFVKVWSFDRLREFTQLVEGDWPIYEAPYTQEEIQAAMRKIPPIEAAIPRTVAEQSGIRIGDKIYAGSGFNFNVVSIIEPLDPHADIWWDDPSTFELVIQPGTNEDVVTLPLILNPLAMQDVITESDNSWRILLDTGQINPDTALEIEQKLIHLKTMLSSGGAEMLSNLPNFLLEYRENLATLRMVLLLLGVQAFLFILFALALITLTAMEGLQGEIAVLASRGGSTAQIVLVLALQELFLALLAGLLLGPLLAQRFLQTWGWLVNINLRTELPVDSRMLALFGAIFGWLIICIASYPAARRGVLEWQQRRTRPAQHSAWQSRYIDLFLLVMGGLALWQLSSSGSFVMNRIHQVDLADPLLLLGPSLLLLAIAMVSLRFFPYLLHLLAWLARGSRGLVLSLSLTRLARGPHQPSQVILLICLACGLIFFSSSYSHSIVLAEAEVAHYRAGADLIVSRSGQPLEAFSQLPGVLNLSPVLRTTISIQQGEISRLLAVDPTTFPQVAYYPPGMTNITIQNMMGAIDWVNETFSEEQKSQDEKAAIINPYVDAANQGNPIPAVFSYDALGANQDLGSQIKLVMLPSKLVFNVQGIITNFPTLSGGYMIADQEALSNYLDVDAAQYYADYEVWLEVDPSFYPLLLEQPLVQKGLLADSWAELRAIQNNAFVQGMNRAFNLNSLLVSLLSVVGLLLIHYFSSQQRVYEFSLLRANGLSLSQMLIMLASDGLLFIAIGMLIGTVIGYGLLWMMHTYLNLLLGQVDPGLALYEISIDWRAVVTQYAWLVLFYLLAILLSMLSLLKSGIHRVLRIGDE